MPRPHPSPAPLAVTSRDAYGEAGLADLIRAVRLSSVGDLSARLAWAAECLGLPAAWATATLAASTPSTLQDGPDGPEPADAEADAESSSFASAGLFDIPPDPHTEPPLPHFLSSQRREPPTPGDPPWLQAAPTLPSAEPASVRARPPRLPLFPPGKTRALLSTALATPNGEAGIDLDHLIAEVAAQRPLRAIPRLRHSTLRLGVQLLIDLGDGLLPFAADQQAILTDILRIVGCDRVQVLRFAEDPARGLGPRGPRTWRRPYTPPPAGTPVVLLTDLGIAGQRLPGLGATVEDWLRFARTVRNAGCPLVALVPYAVRRCPPPLRSALHLVPWDRRTTVSAVRRALGHGREFSSPR